MRYTTYLNLSEGNEHVVDDIPTENVWIIKASFHLPQLILELLTGVLVSALGQVRLELLLQMFF